MTLDEQIAAAFADSEMVTKAELKAALAEFAAQISTSVGAAVAEEVAKAAPAREAGAGRAAVVETEDPREANPVDYVIKKARKGEALDDTDKMIAWAIMESGLKEGMKD